MGISSGVVGMKERSTLTASMRMGTAGTS